MNSKKFQKLLEEQLMLELELAKSCKRLSDLYGQMAEAAHRIVVASDEFLRKESKNE